MPSTRLDYLFNRACEREASENELTELQGMLSLPQYEKQLVELMANVIECPYSIKGTVDDKLKDKTLQMIFSHEAELPEEDIEGTIQLSSGQLSWYKRSVFKYAIAASFTLLMVVFSWVQFQDNPDALADKIQPVVDNMYGAILTLADGSNVVLDSLQEGVIAEQPGAEIVLKNGAIAYNISENEKTGKAINTMTTPPGRQFQMKLPDGTMVWLNASSSITYPSQFNSTIREVSVSGEVYFEVATNKNIPFVVTIDKETQVEVTGTSFNVHAYPHGAVKTTLLEGGVLVRHANLLQQLKPGQQAWIAGGRPIQLKQGVDLNQVIAWKNGLFDFTHQDIESVMNEIGRWYDLRIIFEKEPGNIEIVGEIERNLSLRQLLNILRRLGLQCRLEEKKLYITR